MAGSRTMNSLPLPGPSLLACTDPPCISARRRTSVRPIPNPPCARSGESVHLVEHVENLFKLIGRNAGA
jgi:hypothetical protein